MCFRFFLVFNKFSFCFEIDFCCIHLLDVTRVGRCMHIPYTPSFVFITVFPFLQGLKSFHDPSYGYFLLHILLDVSEDLSPRVNCSHIVCLRCL